MNTATVSAFGAQWTTPTSTVAVLRAQALKHGLNLQPVSDLDAAAAALTAHTVLATFDLSTIDSIYTHPDAAAAAAAALTRAGGLGEDYVDLEHLWEHLAATSAVITTNLSNQLLPSLVWVSEMLPELFMDVVCKAVCDLLMSTSVPLLAAANFLMSEAESIAESL